MRTGFQDTGEETTVQFSSGMSDSLGVINEMDGLEEKLGHLLLAMDVIYRPHQCGYFHCAMYQYHVTVTQYFLSLLRRG